MASDGDRDLIILYAARTGAAAFGYRLTPWALQRILRRPTADALQLLDELPEGALDIEAAPEVGPNPATEREHSLAIGYHRLGSLAGALVASKEEGARQLEAAILDRLAASLPWWTAYGYVRAWSRHPETQLLFAERVRLEPGFADERRRREERHSALLRASRAVGQDGADRTTRARTLLALSEFMRELTGLPPEDPDIVDFARAWRLAPDRLRAASLLYALEALRRRDALYSPPLGWLFGEIPKRVVPRDALPEFERRLEREREDEDAAMLFRAVRERVRPNSIIRAERHLSEDRVREHVEWAAGER